MLYTDDLFNASGIYKIVCVVTGRFYVGSAVKLGQRRYRHFNELRRNAHHNITLQRAFNKYGEESFTFEIIELVSPEDLLIREQLWLDLLDPFGDRGFNIASEAGSSLGLRLSLKHIEKIRQTRLSIGFSPTPETKEKMRQAHLGNKHNLGRKHTPEQNEKNRQTHLGKKQTPGNIENNRQANIGKKQTPDHIAKRIQAIRQNKQRKREELS